MLTFKALHILSMFGMVTIFIGGEIFMTYAFRRRDLRAIAWLITLEKQTRLPFVGIGLLLAGVVFGILTALSGSLDLLQGWMIAAYLLVVAFFVNSAVLGGKVIRLADEAVEAEAGKRPADEVIRHIEASRAKIFFFPINLTIIVALILDMVFKPF